MNFLLDGDISVTQPLAMGQDDGRLDHLVRSQYSMESVGDTNQFQDICRTTQKARNRLEDSQFSTGGNFPVGLYLSHTAMKRPHALRHQPALKLPSSFTSIRVNSVILLRAERG